MFKKCYSIQLRESDVMNGVGNPSKYPSELLECSTYICIRYYQSSIKIYVLNVFETIKFTFILLFNKLC